MTINLGWIAATQINIDQASGLTVSGDLTGSLGASITNVGSATWSGGYFSLEDGTFNNLGIFTISCDRSFAANAFNNYDTLTKSTTNGTTLFLAPFNNWHLPLLPTQVTVSTGTIKITNGGDDNAPFTVAAGAILQMSDGGINTLYPGVDFNGAGVLNVPSRAELQLADPPVSVTISTQFVLGSDGDIDAQLLGPGSVTVTGPFSWKGGLIKDVTLTVSGPLTITGGVTQKAENSALTLQSSTDWNGANDIKLTDASITNKGWFEITNDQTILNAGMQTSAFSNAGGGTVIKTAGAGQTTINVPFQQVGGALDLNSRTISFQGGISQTNADSVTYLDNGTLIVAGTFTVTAGQVLGFGTIQGGLKLDGGTLDLTQETTTGTVSVTGNYEQTAASTIMLKVGDTGGAVNTPVNDQISVTGTATIAGGLTVRLLTGKRPRANDSFKLISATGGLTGTFDPAKVNLQVPGTGLVWDDIAYGTKDVTLTAIAAP